MNSRATARKLINDYADQFKAGLLTFDKDSYIELIQAFFRRVGIKMTEPEGAAAMAIALDEWQVRHVNCTQGPAYVKQIDTKHKKYRRDVFIHSHKLRDLGIVM